MPGDSHAKPLLCDPKNGQGLSKLLAFVLLVAKKNLENSATYLISYLGKFRESHEIRDVLMGPIDRTGAVKEDAFCNKPRRSNRIMLELLLS